MVYVVSFIGILYVSLLALMYVFQRKLMYLPERQLHAPQYYGLSGFEEISFTTSDGIALQSWYRRAQPSFPTIVYFHGNAGNIGDRASIYAALADKGFGVFALSYRGYGKSQGYPSEEGLYADARTAIHHLTLSQQLSIQNILLFGESLGTGVATQMATEFDVALLILQAPYRSVSGRAGEIYYFLPVKLLIKDKFKSIKKISGVKAPLLLFHGECDDVIPVYHGKTLFEAATCSPKRAFFMPNIAHNDFDSNVISAHVLDFAKELSLTP